MADKPSPPSCNTGVEITGLEMDRDTYVSIDTMHITVRYPFVDVFRKYAHLIEGVSSRERIEGISFGEYLIRGGGNGYKVSVWCGDARAYLTDEVDSKRGDGKGMGIHLQLGPKFLRKYKDDLYKAVIHFLRNLGIRKEYPMRISRIDLAVDLVGISLNEVKVLDWQEGWVGHSSKFSFYTERRNMETINIGSRISTIYLRIYDKKLQARSEGDLDYWQAVWGDTQAPVTRVEWEVKTIAACFLALEDFKEFDGVRLRQLANYLLTWGRLAIRSDEDGNKTRWKTHPFWIEVEKVVKNWIGNTEGVLSREVKMVQFSEGYANSLAGNITGGMARACPDDPTIDAMFGALEEFGITNAKLKRDAREKARRYRIENAKLG